MLLESGAERRPWTVAIGSGDAPRPWTLPEQAIALRANAVQISKRIAGRQPGREPQPNRSARCRGYPSQDRTSVEQDPESLEDEEAHRTFERRLRSDRPAARFGIQSCGGEAFGLMACSHFVHRDAAEPEKEADLSAPD